MCYLAPMYLEIISLSIITDLFPWHQDNACCAVLFNFVEGCFMVQNMVCVGISPTGTRNECVFYCSLECSLNINQYSVISIRSSFFIGVVDFLYILDDFLSKSLVKCSQRSVDVYSLHYVFVHFFFQFSQFLLHVFCSSVVWFIFIQAFPIFFNGFIILLLYGIHFCLWYFICPVSILSDLIQLFLFTFYQCLYDILFLSLYFQHAYIIIFEATCLYRYI